MAIDVALEGLTLKQNGLLDNTKKPASGVLSISWFHCRPDLNDPVLKWAIKLDAIAKNTHVDLSNFQPYETLAFRQNAVGKSIIKIEVITAKSYPLIAKLIVGLLGLGIKTVGGLITSPLASSFYDTLVSQLDMDTDNPTIYKVGTATYEIDPNTLPTEVLELPLMMDEKFVIQAAVPAALKPPGRSEYAIPAGENGKVKLRITKFKP